MKAFALLAALGLAAIVGCDDRKAHEKHEYKKSDGTTVTEEKTKTTNDEGDSKVTTEKKVDRP